MGLSVLLTATLIGTLGLAQPFLGVLGATLLCGAPPARLRQLLGTLGSCFLGGTVGVLAIGIFADNPVLGIPAFGLLTALGSYLLRRAPPARLMFIMAASATYPAALLAPEQALIAAGTHGQSLSIATVAVTLSSWIFPAPALAPAHPSGWEKIQAAVVGGSVTVTICAGLVLLPAGLVVMTVAASTLTVSVVHNPAALLWRLAGCLAGTFVAVLFIIIASSADAGAATVLLGLGTIAMLLDALGVTQQIPRDASRQACSMFVVVGTMLPGPVMSLAAPDTRVAAVLIGFLCALTCSVLLYRPLDELL